MAAFGEQIRNAIIQPFSISITYHYPFTFSVEMHSTFEWWTDGVASGESQARLGYPESRLLTTVKSRHWRQNQRIVQRRKLLPSRWGTIHQANLSLFSIVPFQAKGKEGNEDDGLKLMTDTQDPSFLLFTANSLNRIMRIWVRFKRHHRRNIAKTILFFHSYDRKCIVVKSRQNPASSYIHLPSLAMFSLQSLKMPC